MKLELFALTFLASSSAFAFDNPYEYKFVDHAIAWQDMAVANDATQTPKALQGIWWMNGNPLADEMVSFAGVKWQAITENGEIVGYSGALPVYDAKVWSWHSSPAGIALYEAARLAKLVYVAQFNKDFSYGVVTPRVQLGSLPALNIPPSKLLTFAMRKVADGEYSRESLILGAESEYRFRRLIDASGEPIDETFSEFLSLVETQKAMLPVCKADKTPTTLPTKCAQ
jgi:hypothetical protein